MRNLLLSCVGIIIVAVAAPSLFQNYLEEPRRTTPSARQAVLREADRSPSHAAGRQFEVEAARDGHFYVEADVNFRPFRFVVDTGATVVALRQSDAASAGIRVHPSDFRYPVQTANGTTQAAEAMLDSVMIEDIEVRNVRALVLRDDQLVVNLLGGSFLNGLRRFEVAGGTLIFEN